MPAQVSDGAAAALLMTRQRARDMGLEPLGVWRSYAVVGVPPEVMGIGPAYAIPEAVSKAGLKLADIDVFELNEAFASQATYCIKVRAGKDSFIGGEVPRGRWDRVLSRSCRRIPPPVSGFSLRVFDLRRVLFAHSFVVS